MSKNTKIIGAVAVIGFGFILLMMMMGGMMMHARAGMVYSSRMAAQTAESVPVPDGGESAVPENVDPKYFRDGMTRFGPDRSIIVRDARGITPFSIIGGLFRLAALGILGFMLLRFVRKRHHYRQQSSRSGGARVADEVEDEILVGDEIGQANGPDGDDLLNPDEMTVDDLVQAMKRLGIKKLEL